VHATSRSVSLRGHRVKSRFMHSDVRKHQPDSEQLPRAAVGRHTRVPLAKRLGALGDLRGH
jgi:hypothetical protein